MPPPKRPTVPTVSRIFDDGSIVELVYDPIKRATAFAIWQDHTWSIAPGYVCSTGERLIPFSSNNNLIKNEVVLFASRPEEYGSEHDLLADIQSFVHRYADLSASFEQVATYYVILTWLYNAFNELPYLRLRGDFGTGKTRTLLTIGSLCYKAFFASGASTVSPIFHILDAFGGTLVFDEADFRFSDERSEIVKVLNNGNLRGIPVLRTMQNRQREYNPQAFHVFGPKIVATRGTYDDKGLESRFITEEMRAGGLRTDIPINLPPSFNEEARAIRNKLLLYRFRHYEHARIDESAANPELEPRLNQVLMPLLSVVQDPALRDELRTVAKQAQTTLVAERGNSIEAHVLEVLAELSANHSVIPVHDVAAAVIERFGREYSRPITNRWIGSVLRVRLGLETYKSNGVYVVPLERNERFIGICRRCGIEVPDAGQAVDVGT